MASGKIGSHNQHARPEQKMSRRKAQPKRPRWFGKTMPDWYVEYPENLRVYFRGWHSVERQAMQRDANAKRRRRDRHPEVTDAW